ncbi:DUF362 domain-containing protein [Candidatus Poribacteria bacterium]|nr:DUF362 domain-containing protein [Candidatus Poribacteria bacterium]
MSEKINRRDFIKGLAVASAGIYGLQSSNSIIIPDKQALAQVATNTIMVVAQGNIEKGPEPEIIKKVTRESVAALGGMGRFVSKKDTVLVKPNIGWNRTPEQAANTNPYVVEAVVEMCKEAGAKKVKVIDYPVNSARITYSRSGIKDAVDRADGSMEFADERKFKEKSIPEGEMLKSWHIYQDALDADVLINIPIAKHHSLTKLTLGTKNLMGLVLKREQLHTRIDQKLADLSTVIKPNLVIMDAYRTLTSHGPNGGTPRDVKLVGQIIAGTDMVAVDSYAATLFGLTGEEIGYIKESYERGLGEIELGKVATKNVEVA